MASHRNMSVIAEKSAVRLSREMEEVSSVPPASPTHGYFVYIQSPLRDHLSQNPFLTCGFLLFPGAYTSRKFDDFHCSSYLLNIIMSNTS